MNLAQLIACLDGAGLDLDPEQVCDALWLASQAVALRLDGWRAAPPGDRHAGAQGVPASGNDARAVQPADASGEAAPPARPEPPPGQPEAALPRPALPGRRDLYPRFDMGGGEPGLRASPLAIPAGRALRDRLALMRAFKPFGKRWLSRQCHELDEELTVEATAIGAGRHGHLPARSPGPRLIVRPVFRPRRERWYDAELVLEDDEAINVWSETLRDLAQVMRDTGAFRSVRRWRLRMQPGGSVALEGPNGVQVSPATLGGKAVRRLIIVASNGSSARWVDGSYNAVIAPWLRECSVLLLMMTPRERWSHLRLGDAHGLCSAGEAGLTAANLMRHPFWWNLDDGGDDVDAARQRLPLPVATLDSASIGEWAAMQMARGRSCPMFLLDAQPGVSMPAPAQTCAQAGPPDPLSESHFERVADQLRQVSQQAFQLAVWLAPSPFTIAVARLVCATQFGRLNDQRPIADLLQSGLVSAVRGRGGDESLTYYECRSGARSVLMRYLRDADARQVAFELKRRISQYIEQADGAAGSSAGNRSTQLREDADGEVVLPAWAQPFADVAGALLGRPARSGGFFAPVLPLAGSAILWVDDHPSNFVEVNQHLMQRGARVTLANSTREAFHILAKRNFSLIITDMGRAQNKLAGRELLRFLRLRDPSLPVIFFCARSGKALQQTVTGGGAVALTNDSKELLTLVDRTARSWQPHVSTHALAPWQRRVALCFETLGLPFRSAANAVAFPADVARHMLLSSAEPERRNQAFLQVVQSCTDAHLSQIVLYEQGVLSVEARLGAPGAGPAYASVSRKGLVARAASTGKLQWAPDVRHSDGYMASVPGTLSELAIPVPDLRESTSIHAVINIEMARLDALDEAQIAWLQQFAGALAAVLPTRQRRVWLCFPEERAIATARLAADLASLKQPLAVLGESEALHAHDCLLVPERAPRYLDQLLALTSIVPFDLDLTGGEKRAAISRAQPAYRDALAALVERISAGGADHRAGREQAQPEEKEEEAPAAALTALAYSPDGRFIASGDSRGRLRRYDAASGHPVAERVQAHAGQIDCVVFSRDGRWLVSCGRDNLLRLFSADDISQPSMTWAAHENWVMGTDVSPDSSQVASAGLDNTIGLWSTNSPDYSPLILRGHTDAVNTVAYLPDGGRLISGSADGSMRLWDLATRETLEVMHAQREAVTAIAVSPDGRLAASASLDGTVVLWNLRTATPWRTLHVTPSTLWSLAFSPNGRYLAAAGFDGKLQLFTVDTCRPAGAAQDMGAALSCVQFSPGGARIALAKRSGDMQVITAPDPSRTPFLFKTAAQIRRLAAESSGIGDPEESLSTLLFFADALQQTWLVAGPQILAIVVDNEQVRADAGQLQFLANVEALQGVTLQSASNGRPALTLQGFPGTSWYVSPELFGGTTIEADIAALQQAAKGRRPYPA